MLQVSGDTGGLTSAEAAPSASGTAEERMRRLMGVFEHGRVDLTPLLTHRVSLDRIVEGYRPS